MNLSTQLRIILLLVGAAIWLAIYLLGRRKAAHTAVAPAAADAPVRETTPGFLPAEDHDDEFETPAYLRRQGPREPRHNYEPHIAGAHDYVDVDHVHERHFDAEPPPIEQVEVVAQPARTRETVHAGPEFGAPMFADSTAAAHIEMVADDRSGRREPTISFDDPAFDAQNAVPAQEDTTLQQNESLHAAAAPRLDAADIPVVEHPVPYAHRAESNSAAIAAPATSAAPTLSEIVSTPTPAHRTAPSTPQSAAAPASAAAGKSAANAARRKIIALRVPMPERVPGAQLLALLQGERLQHGKFNIFHRLHDGGTVFSVASMVEPGSFDPQAMSEQQFPGVTLFMLLPGPLDGLIAYDQMLSCAQRIAHATGGVLQDERGSRLTPQIMEKLRDEVLDFQHLLGVATAE